MKAPSTSQLPQKWVSKGKTISKSTHHTDMFIIEHADGTWHSVTSSHQIMVDKYPVTK